MPISPMIARSPRILFDSKREIATLFGFALRVTHPTDEPADEVKRDEGLVVMELDRIPTGASSEAMYRQPRWKTLMDQVSSDDAIDLFGVCFRNDEGQAIFIVGGRDGDTDVKQRQVRDYIKTALRAQMDKVVDPVVLDWRSARDVIVGDSALENVSIIDLFDDEAASISRKGDVTLWKRGRYP